MKIQRTFTVAKRQSGWNVYVGDFTHRLNTIADAFLMAGKKTYPNGVPIRKFSYAEVAADLANYCAAMGAKSKDERIACLAEFYQLCDTSPIGFTKKYWYCVGKRGV